MASWARAARTVLYLATKGGGTDAAAGYVGEVDAQCAAEFANSFYLHLMDFDERVDAAAQHAIGAVPFVFGVGGVDGFHCTKPGLRLKGAKWGP